MREGRKGGRGCFVCFGKRFPPPPPPTHPPTHPSTSARPIPTPTPTPTHQHPHTNNPSLRSLNPFRARHIDPAGFLDLDSVMQGSAHGGGGECFWFWFWFGFDLDGGGAVGGNIFLKKGRKG